MKKFLEYLENGDIPAVLQLLHAANSAEQQALLAEVAQALKKASEKLHITPKTITMLRRQLKPGKTYDDFMQAWAPSGAKFSEGTGTVDYYDAPVQVVNAINVHNPAEIISIGLVDATQQEVIEAAERFRDSDAERGRRIDEVAEGKFVGMYTVTGVYTLGRFK